MILINVSNDNDFSVITKKDEQVNENYYDGWIRSEEM